MHDNEKQSISSRGGKREGAGRKPGVRNKKTKEVIAAVEATGITPLEYLLSVMRDEGTEQNVRMQAAQSAAPYCHSKLAAVEISGEGGGAVLFQRIENVIVDPKNPNA